MVEALVQSHPDIAAPQALIFDWDNTLVDSYEIVRVALNQVFTHFGRPLLSVSESREIPQTSLKDSFPVHFGDDWKVAREIYHNHFKKIHLEMLTPHEGAFEVLDYALQLKIPLFIVSNKTHQHLEDELKAMNWLHFFQYVKGSKDGEVDKPNPNSVNHTLKDTAIKPGKQVWFIGDSLVDAECAIKSGCLPIIICEKKNISNFNYFSEPIVFVDSLLDVKELLAYFQ